VVAQPLRRAEELVALWLCVAPLRLGGLRGKKSTPSVWLGGTGELIEVGKQEQLGAGARSLEKERLERQHCQQVGQGMFYLANIANACSLQMVLCIDVMD
jgi:hypothetical protein